MASPLTARLDWLEEKFPAEQKQRRVFHVIVQHDQDAYAILAVQGYDPDSDDLAIINRIVDVPKLKDVAHG